MKCPKCGYIGFEQAPRCRNCGFDFSLVPASRLPAADVPLRPDEPLGAPADLDLDAHGPARSAPASRGGRRRVDALPEGGRRQTSDLPLFEADGDEPLVVATSPVAPLAVRRSTPTSGRTRMRPTGPIADATVAPVLPLAEAPSAVGGEDAEPDWADSVPASWGRRTLAAAFDGVLLLALDVAVVSLTLRVSRLGASEIGVLPSWPLLAFILLIDGGYATLLTAAGGQTLGKMAFRLRVVSNSREPLTVGRAMVRTAALFLLGLPAGLGLWPALFDGARRGLHDRIARTRVVRAPAS